jgi:hypothetical protein
LPAPLAGIARLVRALPRPLITEIEPLDLNQLLGAHQVAVMNVSEAVDETARRFHANHVDLFALRIRQLRETAGIALSDIPFVLGGPVQTAPRAVAPGIAPDRG